MSGSLDRVTLSEHSKLMEKYGSLSGDTLLNQSEASKYLRIKENTLEVWRSRRTKKIGLGYVKVGGSVFYELSALRQFIIDVRVYSDGI